MPNFKRNMYVTIQNISRYTIYTEIGFSSSNIKVFKYEFMLLYICDYKLTSGTIIYLLLLFLVIIKGRCKFPIIKIAKNCLSSSQKWLHKYLWFECNTLYIWLFLRITVQYIFLFRNLGYRLLQNNYLFGGKKYLPLEFHVA